MWWAVLLGVLWVHAWVGQRTLLGLGGSQTPPPLPPLKVAFVQTMKLAVPPAAAPVPAVRSSRQVARQRAESASDAASAPDVAASAAQAVASSASGASDSVVASITVAPPEPAASSASAPTENPAAFDWPPSTRLDYTVLGSRNGPLHGAARVEWRRQGEQYQVEVMVNVGLVFERRMISRGVIGPNGLMPRRYDQETDIPLASGRRLTVQLSPEGDVALVTGQHVLAAPGVQDSASQFVQMTWLFLTRTAQLPVGATVQFPLVLPHRLGVWTYEVAERVMLNLPIGQVETLHLRPQSNSVKPGEVAVEMWMAPQLQYLPVRLRMQQDTTYLELTLKQIPVQAAAPAPGH